MEALDAKSLVFLFTYILAAVQAQKSNILKFSKLHPWIKKNKWKTIYINFP